METQQTNLAVIALFPLVGAMLTYFLGKQNKAWSGWVATTASFLSFVWTLKTFVALQSNMAFEHRFFEWIAVADMKIDLLLRFDHLTAVMCMVVTGIGTLIHLYSVGYMSHDPSRPRFFAYLNLFMFCMLLLVLGGNLLVLFVGWEGVGLCSYLLIGFWHKNMSFAGAGRKAFIVNRIGDAGFLLGMFLLYVNFGSLDFTVLAEALGGSLSPAQLQLCTTIGLLFFIGATGKSAQIPLFVWLPDAMAGPTPVSALIHAATMVTAGVYMMARMSFLYELAPYALLVVSWVALLTAFIAATTALAQNDIKKVLAYSTVSQLGFMFMAVGAGAYWVAIFHVVTHAFFKACLFLCAGSVIHGCHDEQDMRKMGGLVKYMPWTFATYAISTIAIAGIFPFAGYQSKHAILGALAHHPHAAEWASLFTFAASFTAFLTAFYMTRSLAMTFFGEYKGEGHPHESPWIMLAPLVVLASLATVGGVVLNSHGYSLQNFLGHVLPVGHEHESESIVSALIHSWVGLLGVALGVVVYTKLSTLPAKVYGALKPLGNLLRDKYYFDEIYDFLIVAPLEKLATILWKDIDQAVIDGSVNGAAAVVDVNGEVIREIQTGQLRHYALFIFVATILVTLLILVA